ncbi:MAG: metal-dependent hydrolase [Halobacteriota archaeon]
MPSTLVHLGLAALIAAALLDDHYDWRTLTVVLVLVALPELDTFLGLWLAGAHRTVLHNLWVVVIPGAVLLWDTRYRRRSGIRTRWGGRGVRVGWVSLVALLFSHILLDAFFNGVNLLWPVHDAFVDLSGELVYSTDRGFVQTFLEWDEPATSVRGSSGEVHYRTGVDPTPPGRSADGVERTFPIASEGTRFVVMLTGFVVAGIRLGEVHLRGN